MKSYANLEQRMAHAYIEMFPPFVPLVDSGVSLASQKQFYLFMKNVYQTIYDSPELFFKKIYEDDAYPNRFNRLPYGKDKPNLPNHMKRVIKEIDELILQLFSLGQNGAVNNGMLVISAAVEIKKKLLNVLPHFGLKLDNNVLSCGKYDNLFPAWKWMATRENATVLSFSRCLFDPEYPHLQNIYSTLFGSENAFETLVQYLEKNGYIRVEARRGPYTLDYIKQKGVGDEPLGDPKHGDPYHYGISVEYKPDCVIPQFLVLRILGMKNMLLKFDLMSSSLQKFVIKKTKKCDDCRYCTQTDKTGTRKRLCIDIYHDGSYCVCPLYPGFYYSFTELDDELVLNLMAFVDFMDKHISDEM